MSDDKLQPVERIFKFDERQLADPGIHMSAQEVMEMYSRQYPSLTNGEVAGPYYEEGKETYKFSGSYGTKG